MQNIPDKSIQPAVGQFLATSNSQSQRGGLSGMNHWKRWFKGTDNLSLESFQFIFGELNLWFCPDLEFPSLKISARVRLRF
jgi:hypothetical protein